VKLADRRLIEDRRDGDVSHLRRSRGATAEKAPLDEIEEGFVGRSGRIEKSHSVVVVGARMVRPRRPANGTKSFVGLGVG